MEKISLKVTGMSCSHCEKAVANAMEDMGVTVTKVSAKDGLVELEYDPSKTSPNDIKAEIANVGYEVQ